MRDIQIPSGEYTYDNFKIARNIFVDNENKRHEKKQQKYIQQYEAIDQIKTIGVNNALKYAQHDLMVRTLTKKKDGFFDEHKLEQLESFKKFKEKVSTFFDEKRDEKAFDKWHKEACGFALPVIEEFYKKEGVEYGKAQKWVNMTLKYLYCMVPNDSDKFDGYFECCHMPLDSVMIDWIQREGVKVTVAWSNLEEREYKDIVGAIRKEKLGDLNPLQAEFIIWPRMKLKQATEEFLNAIGHGGRTVKKNSLEDDINLIKYFL